MEVQMTYETVFDFFLWSTLYNMIFLLWWAGWIMIAGDMVYKIHSKWFEMPREEFNKLHYTGMAFHKIIVIVFNVIPLLVLLKIGEF